MKFDPLKFVMREGIVLESATGLVPNLVESMLGTRVQGSWWSHPQGRAIFAAAQILRNSEDVLVSRLLKGKVTFVHRRLWPALIRLADLLGQQRLARIEERHTASGKHTVSTTPFPDWVPPEALQEAKSLSVAAAKSKLAPWMNAIEQSTDSKRRKKQ